MLQDHAKLERVLSPNPKGNRYFDQDPYFQAKKSFYEQKFYVQTMSDSDSEFYFEFDITKNEAYKEQFYARNIERLGLDKKWLKHTL